MNQTFQAILICWLSCLSRVPEELQTLRIEPKYVFLGSSHNINCLCISYLLLCNKLPQNSVALTTNIYGLTVFVGQESRQGLAGHLWLKVSHEIAAELLAEAVVLSEESTGGGGSGFHSCSQGHEYQKAEIIGEYLKSYLPHPICVKRTSSFICQNQSF